MEYYAWPGQCVSEACTSLTNAYTNANYYVQVGPVRRCRGPFFFFSLDPVLDLDLEQVEDSPGLSKATELTIAGLGMSPVL